ncbi:MAG: ComF family protein [Desulfovibrio sp.]|uniref:ComF family protein n=1 Tax=Desulfovibrio sp. TaxID=885 RepID=UPI00135E1C82|nr:ComF family protein [Desulfovibrio sp.]MTJ91850.1 ComF family protein [Desulfovibrio sp.]
MAGLLSTIIFSLTSLQSRLGLAQNRCVHCLRPFSPASGTNSPAHFLAGTIARPSAHCAADALLCPACSALLAPYTGPRCPRCGLPPTNPHEGSTVCGACLQNPPPWSSVAFHGLYQDSLRHTLLRLKFDGHLYLAPLLGGFMLDSVGCLPWPDLITAVPQHPGHLRHRGYNQAHELAKVLHRNLDVPLATQLLTRPVPGKEQARLGAKARRSNVQHSFSASPAASGLRVWLVDDVMTTGSTMAAATRALLAAGVTRVDAVFAARTPRNTPN